MGEHGCPWSSPSSAHTMHQRNIQGLRSTSRARGMKTQQIPTARSPLPHHLYGTGSPLVRQRGHTCQGGGASASTPISQLPAGRGWAWGGSPTALTVALMTHQLCSALRRSTDLLWKVSTGPICAMGAIYAVYPTGGSSRSTFC